MEGLERKSNLSKPVNHTSMLMLFSKRTPSSFIRTRAIPAIYAAHLGPKPSSEYRIKKYLKENNIMNKHKPLRWIPTKVASGTFI